jgi:hypothetical protein
VGFRRRRRGEIARCRAPSRRPARPAAAPPSPRSPARFTSAEPSSQGRPAG